MTKLAQLYSKFHDSVLTQDVEPILDELLPHPKLSAAEQLAIYSDGYRIRLLGVLRDVYEASVAQMGSTEFEALARGYINTVPPTSYSIDHYPVGLAEFTLKQPYINQSISLDLINLESLIHQVYWADDVPLLTGRIFSNLGEKVLANAVLSMRPTAKILALRYPASDWLSEHREGKLIEMPAPHENYLLVVRHDKKVERIALTAAAYYLLKEINGGQPIGTAIEAVCTRNEVYVEEVIRSVQPWFAQWVSRGVFAAIEKKNDNL
jgi:Putative DNA-binding domain